MKSIGLNDERLDELRASDLQRLDWRTLFEEKQPLPAEAVSAMDAYFARFLPPGPCVCCGARQGTSKDRQLVDAITGAARFRWGIANGEGHCADCGYPARAYHRNVGPVDFLPMILQYHPAELVSRAAKEAVR